MTRRTWHYHKLQKMDFEQLNRGKMDVFWETKYKNLMAFKYCTVAYHCLRVVQFFDFLLLISLKLVRGKLDWCCSRPTVNHLRLKQARL
jgi:hypothetical protein